jgi:hypothetical protein
MQIKGLENITHQQLAQELAQGAKFVVYSYAISLLIVTFKRGSEVYYIRPGESSVTKGMPYTALSLVAGWWGIPFGPIFTIWSLVVNLGGGKDVTREVVGVLQQQAQ